MAAQAKGTKRALNYVRVVVVPERDNQGRPLVKERHQIERELLGMAGGYSRTLQEGSWVNTLEGGQNQVMHDKSYRYEVACTPQVDHFIVGKLRHWCALLRQEAIYSQAYTVRLSIVSAGQEAHA